MLYFGPFAVIIGGAIWQALKNRKEIKIDTVMNLFGMLLAVGLSCFSGYVFFNLSSMTMVIILCTSGTIGVGSFWSHLLFWDQFFCEHFYYNRYFVKIKERFY